MADAQISKHQIPLFSMPLALGVIALLLPQIGLGPTWERQVELIAMLALAVSGVNLIIGYAGEFALGQPAIYATGAYVAGYLGTHGTTDILVQVGASVLVGLLIGIVTGIPGLRLGNWSLGMTSFFLVLLIPDVVDIFPNQTGGPVGLAGIEPATFFGSVLSPEGYYVMCMVSLIAWLAFMRNFVTSRHGVALQVLRQSPVLASSLGISVFRAKLLTYALGAVPAAIAGALFANLDRYVAPSTFGFTLAITILAASILGGSTSVYGAVIGAGILQVVSFESSSFQQDALIFYGGVLLLAGVLLANGLSGVSRKAWRRYILRHGHISYSAAGHTDEYQLEPLHGVSLSLAGVSKSFGGNRALHNVSLEVEAGKVTAIIGPNGSGKTTLLNVIGGHYRVDEGTMLLNGQHLESRHSSRIASSGLARTFQTPMIPRGISVREVIAAGRFQSQRVSVLSSVLRLPKYWRVRAEDRRRVDSILRIVGLAEMADEDAVLLPLGTRRLLEIARALISDPGIVLLDESASGLDEDELVRLAVLIERIREAGGTIILVEHNFQLVLSLADTIHVLAQGSVIASGTPAEIEVNSRVLSEYLGAKDTTAVVKVIESEYLVEE